MNYKVQFINADYKTQFIYVDFKLTFIYIDTELPTPGTEQCQTHMVDTINNPGTYIMHKMTDLAMDTCRTTYTLNEVCKAQEVQTRADIPTIAVNTDVQCREQCQAKQKIETIPVKYQP